MAMQENANGRRDRAAKVGRKLPHNLDAEASILGGVILHNEMLDRLDTLETEDFYHHPHKVVFEAIRNLQAARKPIDVVTLESEVEARGKLDAIGGIAFLGELVLRVPTPENVVAYAKIVRDHSMLRRLLLKSAHAVERAYDWQYEADELLGETIADLQQIERGYREASEALPIITISGALIELERLARTPVYETPFPALNATLGFGGLLGGQVYYLAGGTGFGKTSWIGALVKHHAAQLRPAIVAFYEMFSGYYVARMAAGVLGVHSNAILRGETKAADVIAALPIAIEFLDGPSLTTIRRASERHVRLGHGAPLIVVDYIQLLGDQIMSTMTRPDARLANAQASAQLRALAKDTGAAIVVVSAASRSTGKKLNDDVRKIPPRDLVDAARESGAIEYDGAGVIVLSVSNDKDGDENIATMTVAKARFGESRHIDARYDGRRGSWREIGLVTQVIRIEAKPDDGSVRAAIFDVLRKYGPQGSKTQIFKLSGKSKQAVFSELDVMLSDETVAYQGGKWTRPDAGSEPIPQTTIQGVG